VITITTVRTSNDEVTKNSDQAWSAAGQLYIQSSVAGEARVYNLSGQLVRSVILVADETSQTPLPTGFYLVALNNGRIFKVIVK
jgi:hypothetical protein